LIPILNWLLLNNGVSVPVEPQWADLCRLPLPRRPNLTEKIVICLDYYPCDLLFVHRDAENAPMQKRVDEVAAAIKAMHDSGTVGCRHIAVVPVRMMEAWLLFDEMAIKTAAGNKAYRSSLALPPLAELELLSDPKTMLHDRLCQACELRGRRLQKYPVRRNVQRVAEFIDDFAPLRALVAFQRLEADVRVTIAENHWS
jgi:hypothetical protein